MSEVSCPLGRALRSFRWFLSSCALSITILGTGAKWLSVLEARNMKPGECGPSVWSPAAREPQPRAMNLPHAGQRQVVSVSLPLPPVETHSLQTLHTILSTGSPLKAQSYEYVYRCIKTNVLLGSISGTAAVCWRQGGGPAGLGAGGGATSLVPMRRHSL